MAVYSVVYGVLFSGMLYNNPIIANGFGIGIPDGIGIDAHPLNSVAAIAKMVISALILGQFFKFKIPSLDLNNLTFYKRFGKAFSAAPQDP